MTAVHYFLPRPPPLPWPTLPNGTFLSIPRGEIHCMPILDDARCYGSTDNWIFLVHRDGKCSLVNPFSKDTLELPNLSTICGREIDVYSELRPHELCKLAVPSPLRSSPDSLVVIMHDDCICICQPPVLTDAIRQPFPLIHQVLFFDGKLYALDLCQRLLILEIDEGIGSMPKISSIECIIDSPNGFSGTPEPLSKDGVPECQAWSVEKGKRVGWLQSAADPLRDSGVYNIRNVKITPLLSESSTSPINLVGQWRPTWVFPTEAI
ncbi:unnamed protein product [Urochloa decumbens]|uniref:KIB1-4 beta-propeller domain-containing protein n=1 Tax=Urochloa decumbens TaxID=240449 RepID=A0ABC9E4Z1_9POAL